MSGEDKAFCPLCRVEFSTYYELWLEPLFRDKIKEYMERRREADPTIDPPVESSESSFNGQASSQASSELTAAQMRRLDGYISEDDPDFVPDAGDDSSDDDPSPESTQIEPVSAANSHTQSQGASEVTEATNSAGQVYPGAVSSRASQSVCPRPTAECSFGQDTADLPESTSAEPSSSSRLRQVKILSTNGGLGRSVSYNVLMSDDSTALGLKKSELDDNVYSVFRKQQKAEHMRKKRLNKVL